MSSAIEPHVRVKVHCEYLKIGVVAVVRNDSEYLYHQMIWKKRTNCYKNYINAYKSMKKGEGNIANGYFTPTQIF